MRSIIFLLAFTAIGAASPPHLSNRSSTKILPQDTVPAASEDVQCPTGFTNYLGWCAFLYSTSYTYSQAVDFCSSRGTYAPSIHSESDYNFWNLFGHIDTYWLDAYCPNDGQPYAWLDQAPTNYYGPKNELSNCKMEKGIQMENYGFQVEKLNIEAIALCFYDLNNSPTATSGPTTGDDVQCASDFAIYRGWCVYQSSEKLTYSESVEICSSMGTYAPSIHSESEYNFWKLFGNLRSFWLDSYCPKAGQPYAWLDQTPTNYYGPHNELGSCKMDWGIQLESFGFDANPYEFDAHALCVYEASNPPANLATTTSTTKPQTTTAPTTSGSITESYCDCNVDKFGLPDGWNPSEIWLDIVVVLDTSMAMGQEQLDDAEVLIESLLSDGISDLLTTDSKAKFFTRLGVITMPDNKVLYDLNMTSADVMEGRTKINTQVDMSNLQSGFESAKSMLDNGLKDHPERKSTRQVVYFMTASNRYGNLNVMDDFKSSGGIIMVNEFVKPGATPLPDLKNVIASVGYYFVDSNNMQGLQAFCRANCFCGSPDMTVNGDTASGGCYHASLSGVPFNKAKSACSNNFHGFLATVHNEEKGRFLQKLLNASKSDYFWIGYEKSDDGVWQWDDESSDAYTNWDKDEPSNASVAKCAYIDSSKSTLPWGAGNCQVGFPYVCQSIPCYAGYKDCM